MATLRPRGTLPKGLAPIDPLRDQQAERRRALSRATAVVLADVKPARVNEWTTVNEEG